MTLNSYAAAVEYIHVTYGRGAKSGLSNMLLLMDELGNPYNAYKIAHVAGTNGKGSVCAFMERGFRAAGHKTGLYTSPYLSRYNERFRINGVSVSDDRLLKGMQRVQPAVESLRARGLYPTEFEIGTALSFCLFEMAGVDRAVIEVGIGGRLDVTNIVWPDVSVIARIGYDHTALLGDTLAQITREKAGIIKPGVPVVLMPQESEIMHIIQEKCEDRWCEMHIPQIRAVVPSLNGFHQTLNALTAAEALRVVGVPEIAIEEAIAKTRWPGRLEWANYGACDVLIDGAHNPQGAQALADYVDTLPKRRTVLVCAIMTGKAAGEMLRAMRTIADEIIVTRVDYPRCMDMGSLSNEAKKAGFTAKTAPDVRAALSLASTAAAQRIVIAGSLYLVGEARDALDLGGANAL